MQLAGPTLWTAPLATGHPLGLPGIQKPTPPHQRVQPTAQSRNPDATMSDGQPPAKFWRAASGEPDPATHLAPPSIMQIKISQMLDEQANEQAEDPPEADDTGAGPSTHGMTVERNTAEADPGQDYLPKVGGAPSAPEPELRTKPETDAITPAKAGYEQASSFSRSEVLRSLP